MKKYITPSPARLLLAASFFMRELERHQAEPESWMYAACVRNVLQELEQAQSNQ